MSRVKTLLKAVANQFLCYCDHQLEHSSRVPSSATSAMQRLATSGFAPSMVADVGAARGDWTRGLLPVFQSACFWCCEPLQENEPFLKSLSAAHDRVGYWIGALGNRSGNTHFHTYGDQSSVLASEWSTGRVRTVRMETLDSLVSGGMMAAPNLLKLDVQGGEALVLDGAVSCLEHVLVAQIEVSFRRVYDTAPLAADLVSRMGVSGFRVFDLCDVHYRRSDRALLQADIVFAREGPWWNPDRWSGI